MYQGFILAGGRSTRMGRDKALLEVRGSSFLSLARNSLSSVCETVSVVLSPDQTLATDLPVIRDLIPHRGALGGLHAALKNCRSKIALVLAVDLPLVTPEAACSLAEIAAALPKYLAVVPRQADGRPQPLFAAYRARFCVPALETLMSEDPRASVRDLLELITPKYIDVSKLSSDKGLLTNVNTVEDFNLISDGSRTN